MKREISNEPVFWLPFSGGGMLAAMVIPIHIVLFGIAIPLGLIAAPDPDSFSALVHHPVTRIYLFSLVAGCMFHWAHRFRYALIDLGIHGARGPIAFLCYGSAIGATIWGGWVFFSGGF